jgi:hypothetical protein
LGALSVSKRTLSPRVLMTEPAVRSRTNGQAAPRRSHVLEEYQLNWRDWARAVIGLPVEWSDFYIVNSLVIVIGIVAANLAASCPGIALALPALMARLLS